MNKRQQLARYQRQLTVLYKKLAMINLKNPDSIKIIQKTNDKIDIIKLAIDQESKEKYAGCYIENEKSIHPTG